MPLAIVGGHVTTEPWLMERFVQLRCSRTLSDPQRVLDFAEPNMLENPPPCLRVERMDRDALDRTHRSLLDFVIEHIDAGVYVHLFVDEYFIPHRVPFGVAHVPHDLLVVGYDGDQRTLAIAGFDEQGRFRRTSVAYGPFELATRVPDGAEALRRVRLLRVDRSATYDFNLLRLQGELEAFASSRSCPPHSADRDEGDAAFGVDVYEALCDYVEAGRAGVLHLETRPLHLLVEHHGLMNRRLSFLSKELPDADFGPCKDAFASLTKAATSARNGVLKFLLTGEPRLLSKVQETLRASKGRAHAATIEVLARCGRPHR